MSQPLNADQELVSDVVACQLVIKQILDVLDVIAPVEVREKNVQPAEEYRLYSPSRRRRPGHHAGNPKSHRAD
ncbi:protein [Escherichia coli]|uniref:Protein n=1 Tax=Escherichia coli TaxID=562 RepID=A0A447XW00_ECOLX|nr:protein [Escherichia coli]